MVPHLPLLDVEDTVHIIMVGAAFIVGGVQEFGKVGGPVVGIICVLDAFSSAGEGGVEAIPPLYCLYCGSRIQLSDVIRVIVFLFAAAAKKGSGWRGCKQQ